MTDHEKRVDELVDLLGCSIVEAEKIIADDVYELDLKRKRKPKN